MPKNSILNTAAVDNSRHVRSGKDGALYSEKGVLLASMESFQSQMNVTNAKYQPLGSNQEFESNTSYGITLNFTEIVVEDNQFITDLLNFQNTGIVPNWKFQGVIKSLTGKYEERYIYPNCIPSGNIDLQNVSSGDVIKRAWSLYVNGKVAQQGKLKKG
jgi:hypothetical protein